MPTRWGLLLQEAESTFQHQGEENLICCPVRGLKIRDKDLGGRGRPGLIPHQQGSPVNACSDSQLTGHPLPGTRSAGQGLAGLLGTRVPEGALRQLAHPLSKSHVGSLLVTQPQPVPSAALGGSPHLRGCHPQLQERQEMWGHFRQDPATEPQLVFTNRV